jgi:toxin ParE1/3/4
MVQIRWTNLAAEDLKGIYDFISRDSKAYAKIQVVRIRTRTKILKDYPLSGKLIPEYQDERYRELIEGSYRIIYKLIDDNTIDILTIHHSARDLSKREIT